MRRGWLSSFCGRATLAAETAAFSLSENCHEVAAGRCFACFCVRPVASHFASARAEPIGKSCSTYFGTYTNNGKSKGIYCYKLDLATGKLTSVGVTEGIRIRRLSRSIPAANICTPSAKSATPMASRAARSVAFALDRKTGHLKPLNHQSSEGRGAVLCGRSIKRAGRRSSPTTTAAASPRCRSRPTARSKRPLPRFSIEGSSVVPRRQAGPHAHSINVSPDNRFAFACDLGLDKILIYKLDPAKGTLTANDPAFVPTPKGGGPRHFAVSSQRPLRLQLQRDDIVRDGIRLTTRQRLAGRKIQTISTLPEETRATRRPRFRFIRRASSCTARTADTTAWRSSPSTKNGPS